MTRPLAVPGRLKPRGSRGVGGACYAGRVPGSRSVAAEVCEAARRLCRDVGRLRFGAPVTHVYNPLEYAWKAHEAYIRAYAGTRKRVVFLGMNPGPFGMAQTGVPFGEVKHVRDWLGICEPIGRPRVEHPRRPVRGFECHRSEVSGERLWGAIAREYGTPRRFFESRYIANYCPLLFMEESGRNRTPNRLPAAECQALFAACDRHLRRVVAVLEPEWVIGVGGFAEERARAALDEDEVRIGRILHPSPASPKANTDWAGTVRHELTSLGVCKPSRRRH